MTDTAATATDVTVPTDTGDVPTRLWLPPSGEGPGIVLLQEIFGVSAYVRRRATDLAALGYVVAAPEIFWRLGVTDPVEGEDALQQGMGLVQRLDWQQAVLDASATVEWLRDRDEVTGGVGVVGFCFGGGLGFNVAAHLESEGATPVDALVSYYGSALPGLHDVMSVSAPSLHHFGLADSFIDTDTVRRIEASLGKEPQTVVVTHPGADHAFDNDDMPWFHAGASGEAWARTEEFLAEQLPTD
ncbi:dienelactone hydrolase family protein [Intrasporangium flavum]|uniref:dienelactone hydrolase family protein n=1 Tax=Intrasporangium flavum TaxID=1428657 RepID=UPI00096D6404|nr:dienelactone hydrolase family protein [Intrasporangium flavum]